MVEGQGCDIRDVCTGIQPGTNNSNLVVETCYPMQECNLLGPYLWAASKYCFELLQDRPWVVDNMIL